MAERFLFKIPDQLQRRGRKEGRRGGEEGRRGGRKEGRRKYDECEEKMKMKSDYR